MIFIETHRHRWILNTARFDTPSLGTGGGLQVTLNDGVFLGVVGDLERFFSVLFKSRYLQPLVCKLLVRVHLQKRVTVALDGVGRDDAHFFRVLVSRFGSELVELYFLNTINGFEAEWNAIFGWLIGFIAGHLAIDRRYALQGSPPRCFVIIHLGCGCWRQSC